MRKNFTEAKFGSSLLGREERVESQSWEGQQWGGQLYLLLSLSQQHRGEKPQITTTGESTGSSHVFCGMSFSFLYWAKNAFPVCTGHRPFCSQTCCCPKLEVRGLDFCRDLAFVAPWWTLLDSNTLMGLQRMVTEVGKLFFSSTRWLYGVLQHLVHKYLKSWGIDHSQMEKLLPFHTSSSV